LPQHHQVVLNPRKLPMQARSTFTVDAIHDATIQVLLREGKERLTTTRVAARAGVSVGTLYQYFPNKSALLQAALKRHLDEVASAVEQVCTQQMGKPVAEMGAALVTALLKAKMKNPKTSVALYSVSSDLDGVKVVRQVAARSEKAIVAMLESTCDSLIKDARLVSLMLQGSMTGISRRLLESSAPEKQFPSLLQELTEMVRAYLATCVNLQPDRKPGRKIEPWNRDLPQQPYPIS